jgi:hypothetical protein
VRINTDGLPSDGFPISNNAPQFAVRTDLAAVAVANGWEDDFPYSIQDLIGSPFVPITLHETFENLKLISPFSDSLPTTDPNYSNWLSYPPAAAQWSTAPVGDWTLDPDGINRFTDHLYVKDAPPGSMSPTPLAISSSPRAVMDISQKLFIGEGTANGFSGQCVQKGKITYFTDHGDVASTSPVAPGDCSQGNFGD